LNPASTGLAPVERRLASSTWRRADFPAEAEVPNDKQTSRQQIRRDFELTAYPVTQEQWQAVMGNNPSHFSRQGKGNDQVKEIAEADLKCFPVEMVSWDDIQEFLKKLNEREKGNGWLYRLPNRAEWEYACRNAVTNLGCAVLG
jgi:formylglycine-generating enzyme required for sulfatase activity